MGVPIIDQMLHWLRAGYPSGIPAGDYVALFGILHRSLTEAEVEDIARQLHDGNAGLDSLIPEERIRELIEKTALERPSEEDVRRVSGRLAKGGWPLVVPARATE